jgi:hypothetical protein
VSNRLRAAGATADNETMRILGSLLVAVLLVLFVPSGAGAAQRWASPASARTAGPCLAIDPCRLDTAIANASAGDEVVLARGTYTVGAPIDTPAPLTLRGARGPQRPTLVGAADLLESVVSFKKGGTLRHLEIRATAPGQDALTMQSGIAEDVVLTSAGGDGAKLVGSPGGTLLRDSVVRTDSAASGVAALKLRESGGAGDVMLRNVTVLAPAAIGVRCEVFGGSATLVNVLVRGAGTDVDASRRGSRCSASHSNFRAALSPGLVAGAGNQQDEPALAGDHRPLAGSPTIDAGGANALLGATDAAGCPRLLGAAPDIGAYEFTDTPCAAAAPESPDAPATAPPVAPQPDTTAELPRGVPAPVQGTTVVVSPGQGKVLVRKPGTTRFRTLEEGARVPVGSEVDARLGRVQLVTAVTGGLQDGTFWGGRFVVRQPRKGDGMTSLVLRGGSFRRCATRTERRLVATASRRKPPIRRLWSRDRDGRFRTHGHNSVATARGTEWVTEDTCEGTLTRVIEGAVSVRDKVRKRTTLVRVGRSYLARRR